MDQAEQLRNMIKLNSQKVSGNARVLTVTSGKGGVGKSNLSLNLALQLKRAGQKVIIFDADIGLANIEVLIGKVPRYSLADVIFKGKNIKEIVTFGPEEIGFVSGGSGIRGLSELNADQIQCLVRNLSELDAIADWIIIDTGAGISDSVMEFVISGQDTIVLTTPEPTSITDAYSLLKTLSRNPNYTKSNNRIHIVVNKVENMLEGKQVFDKLHTVTDRFLHMDIQYLGAIPQDTFLEKAVRKQSPVTIEFPKAKSVQAFKNISYALLNKEQEKESHNGIAVMFKNFFTKRLFI